MADSGCLNADTRTQHSTQVRGQAHICVSTHRCRSIWVQSMRKGGAHVCDLGRARQPFEHFGQRAAVVLATCIDFACGRGAVGGARERVRADAEAADCTHRCVRRPHTRAYSGPRQPAQRCGAADQGRRARPCSGGDRREERARQTRSGRRRRRCKQRPLRCMHGGARDGGGVERRSCDTRRIPQEDCNVALCRAQ
jgi:hypothetical protein